MHFWGSSENLPTGRKEERFGVSDFEVLYFVTTCPLEPLPRLCQQSCWGSTVHVNLLRTKGSSSRCWGRNRLRNQLCQGLFQIPLWQSFSCDVLRYPPVCCAPDCFSGVIKQLCGFSWDYCPIPNLSMQALGLPDDSLCRHCIPLQYASNFSATSRWVSSTEHLLPGWPADVQQVRHIPETHSAHSRNCWIHYGQQRFL